MKHETDTEVCLCDHGHIMRAFYSENPEGTTPKTNFYPWYFSGKLCKMIMFMYIYNMLIFASSFKKTSLKAFKQKEILSESQ